jgi:L-histidine N-alpha-methyltransferase
MDWIHIANEVGIKPWVGIFLNNIDGAEAADLAALNQAGSARDTIVIEDPGGTATPEQLVPGIRARLLRTPRQIAPRFFYDDSGSELFETITQLPEYYQTRTERALLEEVAGHICARSEASTLVELGSGSATKARVLLAAMQRHGRAEVYVPVDINPNVVRQSAETLVQEFPGLCVHGLIGDFLELLPHLPAGDKRLVSFLGSTIGNLTPAGASRFLTRLAEALQPGEDFLLGIDLIKDPARLEAAYNDRLGVTAAFNRNILSVLNRVAGADFQPERFAHRAFYDAAQHWIEMHLVAQEPQTVRLEAAGLVLLFAPGDIIRTEISVKYDAAMTQAMLAHCGFELTAWYTDREQLFGLALARRTAARVSSAA